MDCAIKGLLSRIVVIVFLSLFFVSGFGQALKTSNTVPTKPIEEYAAYAALWRTDGNFRSTIRISNQLATAEIDAMPTIYMADGTAWDLPSVHLAKSGVATVDINEALSAIPDAVRQHLSAARA